MKKFLIAAVLLVSSVNAFAISLEELEACPAYASTELAKSLDVIEKFEKESKASSNLIEVLQLSVFGRIEQSPTCQEVEGMSQSIKDVIKEISKK